VGGHAAASRFAGAAQSHVKTRTAARFDQTLRDQLVIRLHHGGAADAGFFGAGADGRQPRAWTQRVSLDALRETCGKLGGQAVILFGLQRHI
jgi:hypothetical protein